MIPQPLARGHAPDGAKGGEGQPPHAAPDVEASASTPFTCGPRERRRLLAVGSGPGSHPRPRALRAKRRAGETPPRETPPKRHAPGEEPALRWAELARAGRDG